MFALDLLAAAALSSPNVRAQSSPTLTDGSPTLAPASTPPADAITAENYSSATPHMIVPPFVLPCDGMKGVVSPFPSNQGLGISFAPRAAETTNKRPRLPSLSALPAFQHQLARPPILQSSASRHHPYQVPPSRHTNSQQPNFHQTSFQSTHPAQIHIPRIVIRSSPSSTPQSPNLPLAHSVYVRLPSPGTYQQQIPLSMRSSPTSPSAPAGTSPRIPNAIEHAAFPCPSCPKQFTRKHHLVSHMVSHSQLEPLRCPIAGCDATFKRNQDRRRHIRKIKHDGVSEATLDEILSNL